MDEVPRGKYNSKLWIIDSGATDHVCCDLSFFVSITASSPISVQLPNKTFVSVSKRGTVKLNEELTLFDVLFVPSFQFNIVSLSRLTSCLPCNIIFAHNFYLIQNLSTLRMIGTAKKVGRLYFLDSVNTPSHFHNSIPSSFAFYESNFLSSSPTFTRDFLWHYRLGHLPTANLKLLHTQNKVVSVPNHEHCSICPLAKQRRLPFPLSTSKSEKCFDLLHVDIWGPFKVSSTHGYKYFLSIVDYCSHFTWIFLMKNKSETRSFLREFHVFVHNQFHANIKCIKI